MKIQKQREIVIEFEHTRVVRKKAKTHLLFCPACSRETDFSSLREAAALFGTTNAKLFQFVRTHRCHFETDQTGETYLCLVSLLASMKTKTSLSHIKMIGD